MVMWQANIQSDMLGLVCKPKTLKISSQPEHKTLNLSCRNEVALLGLAPKTEI